MKGHRADALEATACCVLPSITAGRLAHAASRPAPRPRRRRPGRRPATAATCRFRRAPRRRSSPPGRPARSPARPPVPGCWATPRSTSTAPAARSRSRWPASRTGRCGSPRRWCPRRRWPAPATAARPTARPRASRSRPRSPSSSCGARWWRRRWRSRQARTLLQALLPAAGGRAARRRRRASGPTGTCSAPTAQGRRRPTSSSPTSRPRRRRRCRPVAGSPGTRPPAAGTGSASTARARAGGTRGPRRSSGIVQFHPNGSRQPVPWTRGRSPCPAGQGVTPIGVYEIVYWVGGKPDYQWQYVNAGTTGAAAAGAGNLYCTY